MIQTPCILFAGGKSSRMQTDKSLLPFGGFDTLCEYQYDRLCAIFSDVYISTKEIEKFPLSLQNRAKFIQDDPSLPLYAPTAAFLSIFQKLQEEKFFVLSVDTPFVSSQEINKLFQEDNAAYDATIAKSPHGIEALCGIYHHSMEPYFQKMAQNNQHKLTQTLQEAKTCYVTFETAQPFLNLNYPKEYEAALKML